MIWVIQQWRHIPAEHGLPARADWVNVEINNGCSNWYPRKCEAQIALRTLPRGRYRILKVVD